VGGVELCELALSPGRLAGGVLTRLGFFFAGAGLDCLGSNRICLQRIDALQQASEQPRRVAADLVAAQRQLLEPVEQHRQPLGAAEHVEEGVEARRIGVLAQQPLAEHVPVADPELLERSVQERLGALAQPLRGGSGRGEDQDTLGAGPLGGKAGEPPCQHLGLAGPRRSEHQQRTIAVRDGAFLGFGQGEHGSTLPSGCPP